MANGDAYTVKERIELLATAIAEQFSGIIRQLDAISAKLESKATNSRVETIERRLDDAEQRLVKVELREAGVAAVSTFQRWLVGVVGVGCLGSIATLVWLASGGH